MAGEHPQLRRRVVLFALSAPGTARNRQRPRPEAPHRWRPRMERLRGCRLFASRGGRLLRQHVVLLQQGTGMPRRFHPDRRRGLYCRRATRAQDARWRHAPGRTPGIRRELRPVPPRRSVGRRPSPRPAPGRWIVGRQGTQARAQDGANQHPLPGYLGMRRDRRAAL